MNLNQIATDVAALATSVETQIHPQAGAGAVVVILNLAGMGSGDVILLRHRVSFNGGDVVVGSHEITFGTTTDDTWEGVAGDTDADGWQTWWLAFGDLGGEVTLEATSGSCNIEYMVLS